MENIDLSRQTPPYRTLFDDNPSAIFAYAVDSCEILIMNPACCRLFGLRLEDAIGKPLHTFLDDHQRESLRAFMEELPKLPGSAPYSGHWRFRMPDGRESNLDIRAQNTDWHGHPARIVVIQDVTEDEMNKAMLEGYQEQLELLVEQRTAALSTAKQEAEAANHAKSVFLSNMSHELRTPLNAILGFASLLERDPGLTPEHRQKLNSINRSGQNLLQLINDVLEISRIEAGIGDNNCEVFALGELLASLEEAIRGRAAAKNLSFNIDIDPRLPDYVNGNPQRLRQVLLNLLGNAVKYTETGRIALRVRPQNGHVRFEVADTGPGISSEERENIFQAFYQTPTGVARGEGTGLGLHLSREYAKLMGGELQIEDQAGWSTVFALTLPLPGASAPSDNTVPRRVIGLQPGQARIRLLLVDDQEDNRWLASHLFEAAGFEVRTAENGEQAIAAWQEWQPHLIWMDMRMPVMDGYEATRRIRALPDGAQVRIAAMTGNTLPEERQAILAAGCDAIVTKPLDEDEVFSTMRELLGLSYRYEEEEPAPAMQPLGEPDFSSRPLAERQELALAAEMLDVENCRRIASQIEQEDALLGRQLKTLIEQFHFDRIHSLCSKE